MNLLKKVKNKYIILRIVQSTLGTDNWWISVLIQEKNNGSIYILSNCGYEKRQFLIDYRSNEVEDDYHSNEISSSGNEFIKKQIEKISPSNKEEIDLFLSNLLDREKIKQTIKQNLRDIKLNNLL